MFYLCIGCRINYKDVPSYKLDVITYKYSRANKIIQKGHQQKGVIP